ncbi:hypothetical protein EBI_27411, partial [Enterocytozoon bieneusi H348]
MILMTADNLKTVLEASDMLEIDGLHAFDFQLVDEKLLITAMDGRAEKRWSFSTAARASRPFTRTPAKLEPDR